MIMALTPHPTPVTMDTVRPEIDDVPAGITYPGAKFTSKDIVDRMKLSVNNLDEDLINIHKNVERAQDTIDDLRRKFQALQVERQQYVTLIHEVESRPEITAALAEARKKRPATP